MNNKNLKIYIFFVMLIHTSHLSANGFAIKTCENILQNLTTTYHDLYNILSIENKKKLTARSNQILMLKTNDCQSPQKQKKIQDLILQTIKTNHSNQISVITNLSNAFKAESESIITGLESGMSYMTSTHLKPKIKIIDSYKGELPALANAILTNDTDLIIAKVEQKNLAYYQQISEKIRTPILFLNEGASSKDSFNFFIYPQNKTMATALSNAMSHRGITKVASLTPHHVHSKVLQELLSHNKMINYSKKATYSDNDFASLDQAIQKLLGIDYIERADEYRKLVEEKKKLAAKNNLPFALDQVYLPPKYDFHAIYIADNFKIARHIAKILNFMAWNISL